MISSSGLIEKLTDKVKGNAKNIDKPKVADALDSLLHRKGEKILKLGIMKGRALVGLNNMEMDASNSLQVHVQFENARYSTKRVMSQVEPVFNEFVEFDLPV
jgi:hypothetical protein